MNFAMTEGYWIIFMNLRKVIYLDPKKGKNKNNMVKSWDLEIKRDQERF
jgi:hypothetical protein